MENESLFKVTGILFIISGILILICWVFSFLGLFTFSSSFIVTYAQISALTGMQIIEFLFITVICIIFSVTLIVFGYIVIKLPDELEKYSRIDIETKLNRLETSVWRIIQHLKRLRQKQLAGT